MIPGGAQRQTSRPPRSAVTDPAVLSIPAALKKVMALVLAQELVLEWALMLALVSVLASVLALVV